jgi:hypothetical protein
MGIMQFDRVNVKLLPRARLTWLRRAFSGIIDQRRKAAKMIDCCTPFLRPRGLAAAHCRSHSRNSEHPLYHSNSGASGGQASA